MSDPIPCVVVRCCREWIVAIGYPLGSCGICGSKRFEFVRTLPEEEWPRMRQPQVEVRQ